MPITGVLDGATLGKLDADRCGMKDFDMGRDFPDSGNPFARYNHQGSKWKKEVRRGITSTSSPYGDHGDGDDDHNSVGDHGDDGDDGNDDDDWFIG